MFSDYSTGELFSGDLSDFAVMVLAAGASERMSSENKLTVPYLGKALITHVLGVIDQMHFAQRIVVVGGPYREDTANTLQAYSGWTQVENTEARQGMGSSIASGAAVLDATKGVLICLADMPGLTASDFRDTSRMWVNGASICRPLYNGNPGHPVLFGHQHYPSLRALRGRAGASALLAGRHEISTYASLNPGVVSDFDTPSDFQKVAT